MRYRTIAIPRYVIRIIDKPTPKMIGIRDLLCYSFAGDDPAAAGSDPRDNPRKS